MPLFSDRKNKFDKSLNMYFTIFERYNYTANGTLNYGDIISYTIISPWEDAPFSVVDVVVVVAAVAVIF